MVIKGDDILTLLGYVSKTEHKVILLILFKSQLCLDGYYYYTAKDNSCVIVASEVSTTHQGQLASLAVVSPASMGFTRFVLHTHLVDTISTNYELCTP